MIFLFIPLLILIDQLTKFAMVKYLNHGSKAVWGHWLKFTYVENPGAAFGILAGQHVFFIVLTVAVLLFFAKKEQPILYCCSQRKLIERIVLFLLLLPIF